MPDVKTLPAITFESQQEWEAWLSKNHNKSDGVWIKVYKKDSGITSIHPPEALEEALCYGWIDGQRKGLDEKSYLQKYTPRRKRSMWSKINTGHIARLTKLGKMKPSGVAEVERAKADGRWDLAYESPKNTVVPEDFLKELFKNKKAEEFFKSLNKTNTFAVSFQINSAKKQETKEKRIKKLVEMFARGEKLY
jgi:uncharacterized protein YdeI (YjbR/CyaY-like superfamily)